MLVWPYSTGFAEPPRDLRHHKHKYALAHRGSRAPPQTPTRRHPLRIRRRRLARRRRSSHKTSKTWRLSARRFSSDGRRRFPRPLEPPPPLIRGTGQIRIDIRQAPHLIVWGILAGCLWAVANTLTIFAIRDIGLSIAFPLWNINSLLGIFWGWLLFNELRDAGKLRWLTVLGGALLMFTGATLLAIASSAQSPAEHPLHAES